MKHYKFQIDISESDVSGNEFWEEALAQDKTGVQPLKEAIAQANED